ncbi:uracil-DNA glycosylase family protein [Marinoscillum pacificum]|uniref:uracil-DNA glycosylase family protein n=1 Tax=Marinoscillum pacificum TaxID=392723 RepID=UPI0021586709|nr:uracil-DNA glycosylase family protein [Marinoscillum pacificum]
MFDLLSEIKRCTLCEPHLALGPRPVLSAHPDSKIVLIGQAPGTKVHQSGIPWDDASGKNLRKWMNISEEDFYNPKNIAIIPMGFCYPGKGKSGDLPPRPECAPKWHELVLDQIKNVKLMLLVGQYAQNYYLGNQAKSTLTETVRSFEEYLPKYLPLPHPSPRNNIWMKKNGWFEDEVLPELKERIALHLNS